MLDYILVFSFLIYLGFFSVNSYKDINSINSFSLGRRSVSTAALGATITATWVSGSGFVMDLTEFYTNGVSYFIESLGMCLTLTLVALCIVPKMKRFLGKISVASIMGEEYGQTVRVITAISGCFAVSGGIFIQFQIMGKVLHYLLPFLNEPICILISSAIVIFYSFSGGIDAVVHTDKIQAVCFILALVIGIILLKTTIKYEMPTHGLGEHFHLNHLLTFNFEQRIDMFLLFAYFLIPGMSPHVVQRISMGINLSQVKKAYLWSSLALLLVLIASCWFSYLLFQMNPHIPPKEILTTLLNLFTIDGTKAILIIGIISMCMSTADSNLNIAAVLIGNDTLGANSLNKLEKLYSARRATIAIGLLCLFFSFKEGSLLDIVLFAQSFYIPIVTVPLLATIFGYKTTERCCLIAMIFAIIFVVIFKFILKSNLNIITIAMGINLISLIFSHYIIEKWELLKCFGIRSNLKELK